MSVVIERVLRRSTDLQVRDYEGLLRLAGEGRLGHDDLKCFISYAGLQVIIPVLPFPRIEGMTRKTFDRPSPAINIIALATRVNRWSKSMPKSREFAYSYLRCAKSDV